MNMLATIRFLDEYYLLVIQTKNRSRFLDKSMPFISALDTGGAIWLAIAFFLWNLEQQRKSSLSILFALLCCLVIGNLVCKPLFARQRPCFRFDEKTILRKRPTDPSFPSGHAMSSFAAATCLLSVHPVLFSAALVLATLIAYSRLYLFVHYPSDVLCGMGIGIGLGCSSLAIFGIL
jgi:undecaprenyl-diphosphatase